MVGWNVPRRSEWVQRPDGNRIAYTVYGEHEHTMVIANGHGAPQAVWHGVIESLLADVQVVIWDYIGQHHSDAPEHKKNIGVASHCQDLDLILGQENISSYIMCGWSLGVQVALAQYERQRARICGLALIHGVSGRIMHHVMYGHPELAFPLVKVMKSTLGRYGGQVQRLLVPIARSPVFSVLAERTGIVESTHGGFANLVEGFLGLDLETYLQVALNADEHSTDHWIHTIDCPTLVTLGKRDSITPTKNAKSWFQMIPGATIVWFEGTHFPMFEAPGSLSLNLRHLVRRSLAAE